MNGRATKSSSIRKSIAIGVLGAAVGGLFPATAFAATPASGSTGSASGTGSPSDPRCTPADLPAAKGYVEGLLKARVVRLERLTAQVGTARYVTASDKAELESELSNELSGMQSLEQQVPGDTTCAELVTNAETMVFNYRVYYVMTPQTELVVVADTETACRVGHRQVGAGYPGGDHLRGGARQGRSKSAEGARRHEGSADRRPRDSRRSFVHRPRADPFGLPREPRSVRSCPQQVRRCVQ